MAALPVPYRTTPEQVNFQALTDPGCDCIPDIAFPTALDALTCNRYEIADFARQAYALGVNYQGVCCGAGPHHIRAMAEALGKKPPASRLLTPTCRNTTRWAATRACARKTGISREK